MRVRELFETVDASTITTGNVATVEGGVGVGTTPHIFGRPFKKKLHRLKGSKILPSVFNNPSMVEDAIIPSK